MTSTFSKPAWIEFERCGRKRYQNKTARVPTYEDKLKKAAKLAQRRAEQAKDALKSKRVSLHKAELRAKCERLDDEFAEFGVLDQQGLTEVVTAVTSVVTKPFTTMGKLFDIAVRATEAVESLDDFFTTNKTAILTQITLTCATVACAPKLSVVILELIKILAQFTTILSEPMQFLSKIWPAIQAMASWVSAKVFPQHRPLEELAEGAQEFEELDPQGGMDFTPTPQFWATAGALAAGVGTLIGATLLVAPNSIGMAHKAFRRASENLATKRIESSIEGFISVSLEYIKKTCLSLFPEGTFLPVVEDWLKAEKVDPAAYVSRVNRLCDPIERDHRIASSTTHTEMRALLDKAYKLESAIIEKQVKLDSAVVVLMRDATRKLTNFAVEYLNAHQEQIRDTPFVITLYSKPGVGKSILTKAFVANMCHPGHGCKVEVDQENLMYVRTSCDKFYTNYRGQSACVVDDWGQTRTASPDNSEMRDFIALVSAVPFSPPQASISDKGRPFNSKLFVATTNNPFPQPTEIVQPTAIYRRRNYLLEMVRLNNGKDMCDPLAYGFYKMDVTKEERISRLLTFPEIIKEMIQAWNAWDAKNQEIKAVGVIEFPEDSSVLDPTKSFEPGSPNSGCKDSRLLFEELSEQGERYSTVPLYKRDGTRYHQRSQHARACRDPEVLRIITEARDRGMKLTRRDSCRCCGTVGMCGSGTDDYIFCQIPSANPSDLMWAGHTVYVELGYPREESYICEDSNTCYVFDGDEYQPYYLEELGLDVPPVVWELKKALWDRDYYGYNEHTWNEDRNCYTDEYFEYWMEREIHSERLANCLAQLMLKFPRERPDPDPVALEVWEEMDIQARYECTCAFPETCDHSDYAKELCQKANLNRGCSDCGMWLSHHRYRTTKTILKGKPFFRCATNITKWMLQCDCGIDITHHCGKTDEGRCVAFLPCKQVKEANKRGKLPVPLPEYFCQSCYAGIRDDLWEKYGNVCTDCHRQSCKDCENGVLCEARRGPAWSAEMCDIQIGIDHIEDHEAQEAYENARAADEETTLTRLLANTRHPQAYRYLIKVVSVLGIAFTTYKAYSAIQKFFGPRTQKVMLPDLDGKIKEMVAYYPASMRTVASSILSTVVAELGVTSGLGVLMAEGGASAYGGDMTLKAVKKQNIKFSKQFQAIGTAVHNAVGAAGVLPWIESDRVQETLEMQGCSDANGLDLIVQKIGPKSCFSISRAPTGDEEHRSRLKGFGIAGRLVAFPWHFVPDIPTVVSTTVTLANREMELSVDYRKAVRCHVNGVPLDLALIELDHSVEAFPDIRKHFMREADLTKLERFKSTLVRHQIEGGGNHFLTTNHIDTTTLLKEGRKFRYGGSNNDRFMILDGFLYRVPTRIGDCGSLLVALNPTLQGRICGMHVAGKNNDEQGVSVPITSELLTQFIDKYFPKLVMGVTVEPNICNEFLPLDQQLEVANVLPEGNVDFVGIVQPRFAQRFPNKTDIVPSPLFDQVYEHTKEPAVLSPSDPRITERPEGYLSPGDFGLLKYSKPVKPFRADDLDFATDMVRGVLSGHRPSGMELRLLNHDEMINGVQMAQYTGMDMSTSPGMPWKNLRPAMSKGKHVYFAKVAEDKYVVDTTTIVKGVCPGQLLLKELEDWEQAARTNSDAAFVYNYENLKQETVSIKNIKIGKTRLFSCAPLHLNMLFRKYFGAWVALQNQKCTELPSAVGINPLGPDWTFLADRLLQCGDQIIAGDFKQWDGKLLAAVMGLVVRDIINPLYRLSGGTEEDDRVRMRLIDIAIHTYTIVGNTLVQKHQGIPSGIPITSDLNSLCNWVYMIVAFVVTKRNHGTCENCRDLRERDFMSVIQAAFYGDDHMLSVAPEARCFFTFNSVQKFFQDHGMGYTDALKRGGESPDFQALEETSFLKRGFKPFEGRWLAPLELDSVKDQINWLRRNVPPTEGVLQNAESVMREFFMHGEAQYNEAKSLLTQALSDYQQRQLEDSGTAFDLPVFSFTHEKMAWRAGSY